jgi:hypothetical protein
VTMPSLPNTTSWTPGEYVYAPLLRNQVSNAVAFLTQPPMFIGLQTTTGQSLTSGTGAAVTIDTELYDNWGGHLTTTDAYGYFGMVKGWYLAEASVPLNYSGTTGRESAGIGGAANGVTITAYGQRLNNTTNGACATVAKLMNMVNVGVPQSGGNDYVQALAIQDSGTAQTLQNTVGPPTTVCPFLKVKWVCALTGTASLIVPTNDTWVSPTSYVTSAFLNKNIQNTINFLIYPPVTEYTYQAGTATLASQATLPTTTGTTVHLDTKTVDTYSAYSTTTNTWTAPVAGVYYAYGQVAVLAGAGGQAMSAGLTVTSSNYFSGTTNTIWGGTQNISASTSAAAVVRRKLRLNAGDTVALAGFQHDTGSAAATIEGNNAWSTRLIMIWQTA